MKKTFTLLPLIALIITLFGFSSFAQSSETITPDLAEQLNTAGTNDMIRINITMAERFNSQSLLASVKNMDKESRRKHAIQAMKDFTSLSQQGIIADLNDFQQTKSVERVKALWIANVISCSATPEVIEMLSYRSDVLSIDYDEIRLVVDASENKDAYGVQGIPGAKEITWNVLKINADDVWALGFTGDGVIVAVIDTGVNYDHFDLADHMWESEDYPNHGWDFYDNDDDPKDEHGHGTHCSGTVAGDGTSGSQTGVAPDASIMACKVGDEDGNSSESMIWAAAEFAIENGAHVLSLSMGWLHAWNPNRTVWRETFDGVLTAGVAASVAAGNEGDVQGSYPIPDNVRTPGDCPPPWLNPDQTLTGGISGVICVGSTTSSNAVSSFSGRGPSTWESVSSYMDYAYNPEMGLIRPDIVAPGSNIKSLAHYSNIGYESGWSGTSMATPANAGMIALMLQKNSALTPEQISQTSEETAEVLVAGKNNNSGAGRIDCLAAVEASSFPGPSYYAHVLNDESGNNDSLMNPGESILLSLSVANFSEDIADDVTVELTTESEYIFITDDTEYYGDFSADDIIEIEDAFAFEVAVDIPGGEMVKFILIASNSEKSWESSFSVMAHAVNLVMSGYEIDDYEGNNSGGLDPGETADILVETTNEGQVDALATMASLTSQSGFITVNTSSVDLGTLGVEESMIAIFNVTVDDDAPTGITASFLFEATSGYFELETILSTKIGAIVEDFETGDFTQFDWTFAGNADWEITDESFEGMWAAKSGNINDQQTSEIVLTYEAGSNDSIAFQRKVSSEGNYDYLSFYIDDQMIEQWSGEEDWERVAYPVAEGEHTFTWAYEKDYSVSSGSDEAWIDFIELPGGVDESFAASAGVDEEICEGEEFQTNAIAQNYDELLWETSGTGTFNDDTLLVAIYTPSDDDYANGMVILSLTAYANGQDPIVDEMELSFNFLPEASGPIIGAIEVCNGTNVEYEVDTIGNSDSYNWEITPQEAGTVNGDDHMITIDWNEDYIGEATLKVQGTNDCGGGTFSEELVIMVDECSGIGDKKASQFTISPNPNKGDFQITLKETPKTGASVKMIDLTGNVVFQQENLNTTNLNILVGDVDSGVYFLIIEHSGTQMIEKVVIQK